MEGVPRISMMSFPLRKSADAPSFKSKLKAYIRDEYKEDGESYNTEIHELESLRAGAIHISKDFTGCSTLKKYFCQLNFLRTRFPMMEGGPCAITFSWYDVFSETVHGWADVEFEMSCILYNIGALHSELGATDNRQTADGMKNACTHFQCAAWAFQQMRHNYQNFFTQDISPDTLSIMTNICLAQAQECILEKSLIDNRKSTITAKVALQIVEYYQLATKTCEQMIKDAGQYSDKVIKAVKKWKKLIELKSHYYGSISLLYRGLQAEDESKYGERVTFYKAALEKLTEAAKSAKSMDKTDNVHDTIQFTFDVVQGKVTISERENEFVYHEKVPELSAISSEIKGVSLVKGIPFKFDDPQIAGPDIFGRLVPIEAHEVSSLYSEEKAKILRHYTNKIEGKNEALDKMIIALQLDQLDFQSSIKKIPQELVDCCAALSVNKDAVKRLSDSMAKLSGMFHDVEGDLGEIEDILKEDEVKEKEHQEIMGTKRPSSNVILELNRETQKYRSAHSVAAETNQNLHEALSKHVGNLQILMKPFDEVMNHIPSFEEDDQADQEAIAQMKKLIGKVDEMRKQRITLENQLRESIHSDDITNKIVIKVESDLMELFREELKKHDKVTQILDQNLLAQDNIIRALTEANANYAETRKKTVQVLKRRDKVIEDLLISYENYDELLNKCNKGIEFYTKLDSNVQKLLQRVRSVTKVQEEERESSMKSLINKTKAMNMNFSNMSKNPPVIPSLGANPNAMTGFGGYAPVSGGHFVSPLESQALPPTSGGHLKLKDVLAMKKQPQQQPGAPNAQAYYSQQNQDPGQHLLQQQLYYGGQQGQGQPPVTYYPPTSSYPQQHEQPQPINPPPPPQQYTPSDSYLAMKKPPQQQPAPQVYYGQQNPAPAQPQVYYSGQQGQDQPYYPPTSSYPQQHEQPQPNNQRPPPTSSYSQQQPQPQPPNQQPPPTSYPQQQPINQPPPPTSHPQQQPQPMNQQTRPISSYQQQPQPPNQQPTPTSYPQQQSQSNNQPPPPPQEFIPNNNYLAMKKQPAAAPPHGYYGQQNQGPAPDQPIPQQQVYYGGQQSLPQPQGPSPYYPPTSSYPQQPQQPQPSQQDQPQPEPTNQPPPPRPPPQEYNPDNSFLAKYVKQHLGPTTTSSNNTPTSYLGLASSQAQSPATTSHFSNGHQQTSYPALSSNYQPPGTSGQYGYSSGMQQQHQYPNQNPANGVSNSNGGLTNNQNQNSQPQQQNYYNNANQSQPGVNQPNYYSSQQGQGQYYPPSQQQNPNIQMPQKQSGNIDLLSDLDLNGGPQPLTPALLPTSANQEDQT